MIIATCLGGIGFCFIMKDMFIREHSNTGHLVLLVEGWNLAKQHLLKGRGVGYSGPASHQLCYREIGNTEAPKAEDFVEETDFTYNNPYFKVAHTEGHCEQIRLINKEHTISTFGFNPENQYLQILMEYGIIGL